MVRIVRHVEHCREPNSPWILFGRPLLDHYGYATVDRLGNLRVALGAENGTGAGIGIDECDVLGAKSKVPILVIQVSCVVREKEEIWRLGS